MQETIIKAVRCAVALLACVMMITQGICFTAIAQEAPRALNDRYTIDMEYLSDEQALRISQRLVYVNRSKDLLEGILFYAAGNMFRRESALMYESDDLESVFFSGYAPGGIDIQGVRVDGQEASWGMQGQNETVVRVSCSLEPGEEAVFEFDYYLLLSECGAFMGIGETDIRLSAFYFIPGQYNDHYGEFDMNAMLPFTRWLHSDLGDYDVTLTVPNNYDVASSGNETLVSRNDLNSVWHIQADGIREFAVSFGKRYRVKTANTESGIEVRSFVSARSRDVLEIARQSVEVCEKWFGSYPVGQLDIVQSDYPLGTLNYPGVIWVSSELLETGMEDQLKKQVRFCVAQQYFGLSAFTAPSSDAWMSDSVCEYISYLLLEESEGKNAFLKAVNADWVDALQLTIPGGLSVTSDATLFEGYEYDIVVRKRGAVVMHELCSAMGRNAFLDGLAKFYNMGMDGHTLTEMELVEAFDTVSGNSWEAFLTDWVFNVGEYVNQNIEWFE